MSKLRVVGLNFDHMHMGDLLRRVAEHPDTEIVGVWHTTPDRPREVLERLQLPTELLMDDWRRCLDDCKPDAAIVCSSTATHGLWAGRAAEAGVHVLLEKPFAATLAEADQIIAAVKKPGQLLAINWPLAWYPCHRTMHRLISEGAIGDLLNVHYYDGNRGPVRHKMDKIEVAGAELLREKQASWFYQRAQGGGALLDYMGYGTTLATWFNGGKKPIEVTCTVDQPAGLEVDEHAVAVARYDTGLSKFETRWGTFTDPWTHQPQPHCGFVACGTRGTIASYDYTDHVRVQDVDHPEGYTVPVDVAQPPLTGPIAYFVHCIQERKPIEGPLSPAVCRIGQQIVDTAVQSAQQKRTLPLVDR